MVPRKENAQARPNVGAPAMTPKESDYGCMSMWLQGMGPELSSPWLETCRVGLCSFGSGGSGTQPRGASRGLREAAPLGLFSHSPKLKRPECISDPPSLQAVAREDHHKQRKEESWLFVAPKLCIKE